MYCSVRGSMLECSKKTRGGGRLSRGGLLEGANWGRVRSKTGGGQHGRDRAAVCVGQRAFEKLGAILFG